jgi:DNA-binding HxlR family transcriptional regulator
MVKDRSEDNESCAIILPPASGRKDSRSYISSVTKAATHPVRSQILKALKEGDKSTVELERVTCETRYNLYHHLNALEQVGLVNWTMRDNKTKLYHASTPNTPEVAVIILSEEDVAAKKGEFQNFLATLGALEGEVIPHPERIKSAEICLYYDWEEKKGR